MEKTAQVVTFQRTLTVEKEFKVTERSRVALVRDEETRQRFIYRCFEGSAEVYRRMCSVACPYLPRIYELREENGQVSVLEEYIQGDTLAFLLEGKPLEEEQARQIVLQLCQALEVLHAIGAVHRDIKPENILLRGSEAVLIDFDASRVCKADNTTDTRIMGTTGYAAPEQYGFSQTDARADIYAVGVLLNEMLTKQHPSKHLAKGKLRPVIEQCIEVNMDKRYCSAVQLSNAILACGKSRKKQAGMVMSLAAAAVALFTAGLLFGQSRSAGEPVSMGGIEVFEQQKVTVSEEPWQGTEGVYETPFRYDLDGDGTMEEYRFGVYQANVPEGYRHSLSDSFGVSPEHTSQRNVYPCVWKYNADETVELMEEFSELLTDAQVTLWRGPDNDSPLPEVYTSEGYFEGGLQILYTHENKGIWFYEIHAALNGHELTALARSQVSGINQ